MKKLLATICLLPISVALGIALVFAQSAPNWPTGYNPTTAEINAAFAQKLDITNGTFTGVVNATTLNVSGLSTLAGSLTVAGNESIGGTLTVGGLITFTNLAVTGSGTFSSTVSISGPATLASATVTGNETVGGTLGVTGASTLASLGVTNNATVGGNQTVAGTLKVAGAFTGAQRNFLSGLTLTRNSTTVLGVSAGEATDSTNAVDMQLGAFTKSTAGTWAAGTGGNGMGTGLTIANSTWYHVFEIINAGVADVYFDTSVTAANKPASTTAFRRIGSFKTDGSAQILAFSQNGDKFDWSTPIAELTGSVPGVTTAQTLTLAGAPPGVVSEAIFAGSISDVSAANTGIYISSLAQADVAVSSNSAITAITCGAVSATSLIAFQNARIMTDASQRVRWRISATTGAVNLQTYGWIDSRGKNN